jgi:alkaline phosphatase D
MQRRHFFRQLSRAAAVLAWQQVFASAGRIQPDGDGGWRESADVFSLGVASGEPQPDAVVLWTRLAPKPLQADGGMPARALPVSWEVALDPRFTQVVRQGVAVADPAVAHSVHVVADGLQPGREYHYRFSAAGQYSPVGRTRTAPAPDAKVRSLRMALASCQHYEHGYFTAHREISDADLDLVVFVGDYIYTDETPSHTRLRTHPHEFPKSLAARTLADYRVHHASYKLDADLRAAHAAHPWLMVWDDHEVMADYAGDQDPYLADAQAFLAVRAAAYKAYFEHVPVSPNRVPVDASMPMQGHIQWGQLADLWLLDTRQYRDAGVCTGPWHAPMNGKVLWHCDAAESGRRTMLGQRQENWLADGLAGSVADWKFIVQTTQMSPGVLHLPVAGDLLYAEGWDAFPAARTRVMEAIAQPRVQDVVVLGGDVHRHVAANLRLDPRNRQSPIVASELVASSISSKGLSEFANAWIKASNPDIVHMRSDERGYALIEVTPQQIQCDFRATLHPVRAQSTFHTQARCLIERGVPGVRKV